MWANSTVQAAGETLAISESQTVDAAATVLMFPGLASPRLNATNTQLAARLEPFGVRSIACDLSGHGDSSGSIEDQTVLRAADQIGALVDYTFHKYKLDVNHPLAIVGSSFSGNAAIIAAARSTLVSALALKAPVTDYVTMRTALIGSDGMEKWKESGIANLPNGIRSSYTFIEDSASVDTYALLAGLKIPVFAIHGSNDEEIPVESRKRVERVMTHQEQHYVLVPGGDHPLSDPHFKPTIAAIGSFLEENLHLNR